MSWRVTQSHWDNYYTRLAAGARFATDQGSGERLAQPRTIGGRSRWCVFNHSRLFRRRDRMYDTGAPDERIVLSDAVLCLNRFRSHALDDGRTTGRALPYLFNQMRNSSYRTLPVQGFEFD